MKLIVLIGTQALLGSCSRPAITLCSRSRARTRIYTQHQLRTGPTYAASWAYYKHSFPLDWNLAKILSQICRKYSTFANCGWFKMCACCNLYGVRPCTRQCCVMCTAEMESRYPSSWANIVEITQNRILFLCLPLYRRTVELFTWNDTRQRYFLWEWLRPSGERMLQK